MFTYLEINKAFSDIAVAHKQINTYGIGDIWEIATSGTIRYPLMWAKPEPSRLETKTFVSSWSLIFMDLSSEFNENDVISDMEQVCLDVIALLKDPDYDFNFNSEGITIERFTERFDDMVSGVVAKIEIRVPYDSDRCAVPTSTITIGDDLYYVSILNAITGATIATVSAPGSYSVYQWSGIDEGDSSTTYSDGLTDT